MSQADYFLKIEGVTGESTDSKHKGEIDVHAFSWGASNSGSTHMGGGSGAGKVNVQDISISKNVDSSSPWLFQNCASGTHLTKAVLVARKAGGEQMEYLEYTLTDVLISSYQLGGGHGGEVNESISLNFGAMDMVYYPQAKTGSKQGAIAKGWDIKGNKKK